MSQETGAGGVGGIEELALGALRILAAGEKVGVVLGCEEGGEMVVEPPGDPGRRGIFEVDNGVFVAGEVALVEKRASAMHQAVELISGWNCTIGDAFAMEPCKQRSGAGPVKAFVVIEDSNLQYVPLPASRNQPARNL